MHWFGNGDIYGGPCTPFDKFVSCLQLVELHLEIHMLSLRLGTENFGMMDFEFKS